MTSRIEYTLIDENAARRREIFDRHGALWHVGGVLEESDVARHQGRRGKAKHLPKREIPGHYRKDSA